MARKLELGLKYFPHDADMAYDRNIRKLTKAYGVVGYGIYTRLLECIYRNGHYIQFSNEFAFDVLDSLNMEANDEHLIFDVVNLCVEIGLFDKDMFLFYQVLTSHGIQERYFFAKEQSIVRSIRNSTIKDYEYLLVDLRTLFSKHYKDEQPMLTYEEPIMFEPEEEKEEPIQAPVLSIVQEPKLSLERKQSDMKKRDDDFRESLKPFLEMYGRELLNEFYMYWSEPNKSKTKMRFEQQPTWDLTRRLSTWSRNNYNKRSNGTNRPDSTQSLVNDLAAMSASRRQSESIGMPPGLPE